MELTFEPRGDLIEFYADDMLYYAASNNQGYDGTLSIATIPEKFAIDALGEELDETDGVLNELADAKGKPFALLFEFDGDVNATRHVMYNCSASRPTLASKTKTSSAEPNTNELKFVSSPIILAPGEDLWLKQKQHLKQRKKFTKIGTKKCTLKTSSTKRSVIVNGKDNYNRWKTSPIKKYSSYC